MPSSIRRKTLLGPEGLEPRLALAADGDDPIGVFSPALPASPAPIAIAAQSNAPSVTVRTSAGDWTNAFVLQGKRPNSPVVRVAFDPQPEPPGATALSLANPARPRLTTAAAGESFRAFVSVSRGGAALSLDPAVFDQAQGVVRLVARDAASGQSFRITLTVRDAGNSKPSPGSLVGLNPQPLPPGEAGAVAYGFGGSFGTAARANLTVAVIDNSNTPVALAQKPDQPLRFGQSLPIFFTLSRESTTFGADDIVVTGGTLSNFEGSGDNYSALFTPTADSVTPGRIEVPAGVFTDSLYDDNQAGGLSKPIAIDTRLPTVTVTRGGARAAADKPIPAGGSTPLIFTLSEPVIDFTAADVVVTGGKLVGFAGRGTTYRGTFVPDPDSTTPGDVTIPARGFADLAGNFNPEGGLLAPIPVDTRPAQVTVTREAATIQEAVAKVADGGTVRLPPGIYDVSADPVRIVGKVVNLIGIVPAGKNPSRPVIRGQDTPYPSRSPDDSVGLINFGAGGGGRVANLTLEGGDAGALGYAERGISPRAVTLANVSFVRNGRGLAGTFHDLTVRGSKISEAHVHGASLAFPNPVNGEPAPYVQWVDNIIEKCGSFGLRIESYRPVSNPLKVLIDNQTISFNGAGGAVLIGPMNVQTLNSRFLFNTRVGFWASDIATSNNLFFKSRVVGTKPPSADGPLSAYGFVLTTSGNFENTSGIKAVQSDFILNGQGVIVDGTVNLSLAACTVTKNVLGVVAVHGATILLPAGTSQGNTEEDFITDGDFPAPPPPPIPAY